MFLGEYQHSVDDKSRLVMPSKFRHLLSDGLVVTRGQDHCVYLFSMDRWAIEVERVNKLPRTNARNRNYARSFFSQASHQELDKQGRINGIQALKCRCPGMELSEFRAEIEKILPGTRVKILGN